MNSRGAGVAEAIREYATSGGGEVRQGEREMGVEAIKQGFGSSASPGLDC
jgi:hypothetical protein